MRNLGQDIHAARHIFEFVYGEQETWKEVNVKRWMAEADKVVKELRVKDYFEALNLLMKIPTNILQQ